MPLHGRKQYELAAPPKDLKEGEEVFVVRGTNEVFKNYDDYLEKILLYREKVWSCKFSGKTYMTYWEAMECEAAAESKLEDFPDLFLKELCNTAHYSQARLEKILEDFHAKIKKSFLVGEELWVMHNTLWHWSTVLAVPSSGNKENVDDKANGVSGLYELQLETGEKLQAPFEEIRRQKVHPVPKSLSKKKLRDITTKDLYVGAPWIVREDLVKKFNLPTEPPKEIKEVMDREERKKEDEKAKEKAKEENKRKREEGTKKQKLSDEEKERIKKQKREEKAKKRAEEKKKAELAKIVYPCEDTLLDSAPYGPRQNRGEWPQASTDFLSPRTLVGHSLGSWSFLFTFSEAIGLSRFRFDDLENALDYEGESSLINEMHTVLLHHILEVVDESALEDLEVSTSNWQEVLKLYLETVDSDDLIDVEDICEMLGSGLYHKLSIESKVMVLYKLTNDAMVHSAVKEHVEYLEEEYRQVKREKREQIAEANREKREALKAAREKRRLEREKAAAEDGDSDDDSEEGSEEEGSESGEESSEEESSEEESSEESLDDEEKLERMKEELEDAKKQTENGVRISRQFIQELNKKIAAEEDRLKKEKLERERQKEAERRRKEEERKAKEREEDAYRRKLEKYNIRLRPVGLDRFHRKYWFFHGEGRLFVEAPQDSEEQAWQYYSNPYEIDLLIKWLDPKGEREHHLQKILKRDYGIITSAIQQRNRALMDQQNADKRRSKRLEEDSKKRGFLGYVNKLA